jgi:putative flippase GtrA
MLKSLWEHKKVRFVCAGTLNAVVDLSILNTLVFKFHFPVWLGNTIAVSVAITMSYFLNHRLVFRHNHNPSIKQYLKFFLVTGVGVIVTQTLIIYLTRATYNHLLHTQIPAFSNNADSKLSLNLAKITAALIGIVWNYLFY